MSNKAKVVFVDDEHNILNGIRRSLRGMREHWDMEFFTSGREALAGLSKAPAHVVVSDMRMPEMDGAEFLSHVKKRWPQTVRIILSGFSSEETVLRTIGNSHRYLAKPCENEVLIDTIKHALGMRKILSDEALTRIINKIDNIPILPKHLIDIIELVNHEHASTREIGALVSQDVALSAQLLKLTNSAYFGLPVTVTDPQKAVAMLGFETVKTVVMLTAANTQLNVPARTEADVHRINVRSLQIAQMASQIASAYEVSKTECEEISCIGALMHVGSLVLVSQFPDDFARVVEIIEQEGCDVSTAERRVFGTDHGAVGAYLLGVWGFNDNIVDPILHHHHPSQSAMSDPVLICTHVAQYLGKRIENNAPEVCEGLLDAEFVAQVGIRSKLDQWASICQSVVAA